MWPTPDPIGIMGGINLYTYVGNNPVNRVDLLGLYAEKGDAAEADMSDQAGGDYGDWGGDDWGDGDESDALDSFYGYDSSAEDGMPDSTENDSDGGFWADRVAYVESIFDTIINVFVDFSSEEAMLERMDLYKPYLKSNVEQLADGHYFYKDIPTSTGDVLIIAFELEHEYEDTKGTNDCHGQGFN